MPKTTHYKETQKFAEKIARDIIRVEKKKRAHALVVALSGDLGSGKTTFTQGFAKAFGIKEKVLSPTFIIARIYPTKKKPFSQFIHIDAYRFEKAADARAIGWSDMIKDSGNIIVVEWAEKIKKFIPKDAAWIHFRHEDETTRTVSYDKKR